MLYTEFQTLTNSKVSYQTYSAKIEPEYMESDLSKQKFCTNYTERTKRTKVKDPNSYNKDCFIKAVKFSTALKALSKMVQENDGDVFYYSDVLWNYEQGVKRWEELVKENELKGEWHKIPHYKLIEEVTQKGGNSKNGDYFRNVITTGEYYDYWRDGESYFRLNIELLEDGRAYIDCGYQN